MCGMYTAHIGRHRNKSCKECKLQVHMLSSPSLFSTVFIILVLGWEDTNYKLSNFEHSPSLRCCTDKCTHQPCNVWTVSKFLMHMHQ